MPFYLSCYWELSDLNSTTDSLTNNVGHFLVSILKFVLKMCGEIYLSGPISNIVLLTTYCYVIFRFHLWKTFSVGHTENIPRVKKVIILDWGSSQQFCTVHRRESKLMCTNKMWVYNIKSNICRTFSYLAKHDFLLFKLLEAHTVFQGLTCSSLYFPYL